MRAADPAAKLEELISRPLVKVCGLTRADVAIAAEAGADLAGFILVEDSPRRARQTSCRCRDDALGRRPRRRVRGSCTDLVQLYEQQGARSAAVTPCFCRTARSLGRSTCPGSDPEHLARAARADGRVMLAGRLGPDNVRRAIEAVHRGPSTRPPSSSASRESRIPTRCAPSWRRDDHRPVRDVRRALRPRDAHRPLTSSRPDGTRLERTSPSRPSRPRSVPTAAGPRP